MEDAIRRLEEAKTRLEAIKHGETYTIKEMREIRKLLLDTVRNNIDPYALGHAPDQRHY